MVSDTPSPPLVSVIMAHRNGAKHLAEAMRSVLAQSERGIELIVSDDGSDDGSIALVREFAARDGRVRLIEGATATGPGATRNRAIRAARGEWLAIVDSDDLLHPFRFERLIERAEELSADGIADDLIYFGEESGRTLLEGLDLKEPLDLTPSFLLAEEAEGGAPMGYLKPVVRRRAMGELRYAEDLPIGEDFDLLLRLVLSGVRIVCVPEAHYLYRRHRSSLSHRLSAAHANAMKAGLNRLAALTEDDPDLARLVARRRKDVDRSRAFAELVAHIKTRRPAKAGAALLRDPRLARDLAGAAREHFGRKAEAARRTVGPLWIALCGPGEDCPADYERFEVSGAGTASEAARLAALPGRGPLNLRVASPAGLAALGFFPHWKSAVAAPPEQGWTARDGALLSGCRWPVEDISAAIVQGLVHVRTPTYRRAQPLRRALESLRAQTHTNWVCDVYDDDPDCSAREVVRELGDPRIRYTANPAQLFASGNIDQCFTRANPHRAEFFFVLEDDNHCLPRFIEDNIRALGAQGVEIVLRNQLVELGAETESARLSDYGILDRKLIERVYDGDHFRMSLMSDIGVSNGGLFWSCRAASDLEIHHPCSAAMQEFYRTFAIAEPVFVAMEPLAVWAENGADTTRDLGDSAGWLWRELRLKSTIGKLRRAVWGAASPERREGYTTDDAFRYPMEARERGLLSSLSAPGAARTLAIRERARLLLRGSAVRIFGLPERGLTTFLKSRAGGAR